MKTPTAVRAAGANMLSKEAGNLKTDDSVHGTTIAQRRAASIRKQALGQIGGAR